MIRGAGLALLIAFAACGGSEPDLPPGLGDRIPDAPLEVVEAAGSDWSRGDAVWLTDLEGRPWEGGTYSTVVDPGDLLAETFWIRAIPRFVLLDPEGRLAWDMMGSWAQGSVRLRLEEMAGR